MHRTPSGDRRQAQQRTARVLVRATIGLEDTYTWRDLEAAILWMLVSPFIDSMFFSDNAGGSYLII
jgi:hypothetical protein